MAEPVDAVKEDASEFDKLENAESQALLQKGGYTQGYGGAQSLGVGSRPGQNFFEALSADFGRELLILICVVEHCLVGFDMTLVSKATPYMYLAYNVQAPIAQMYTGFMRLAFVARPIMGLISDILPIRGLRLAPYMLLWTALGVTGLLYLSLPALGAERNLDSVVPSVIALVFFWLQGSACQLLEVVRYGEAISQKPHRGPNLVSFVSVGLHAAELLAVLVAGPLLEHGGYSSVYLLALIPAATVAYPVLRGYLGERRITGEELAEVRTQYYGQLEICVLGPILFVGAVVIMIVGLVWHNPVLSFIVGLSVGAVVMVALWALLSPSIAQFNMFLLIALAVRPDIGGALFYFYTDTKEMYPEGPHFSVEFFNSVVGAASALCGVLGALTYYRYLRQMEYKSIVVLTNILFSVFALLDVLLITRLNLRLGIPDHFLVLGLAGCEHVIEQWAILPAVLMLSAMCPKGTEGAIYALLLGCIHLGQAIASTFGAFLLQMFRVNPSGLANESLSFENLWIVALLAAVIPLLGLCVIYRLIPDVNIAPEAGDRREGAVPTSASEGSPLKRWLNSRT